jgi:heat shock protein HslJ
MNTAKLRRRLFAACVLLLAACATRAEQMTTLPNTRWRLIAMGERPQAVAPIPPAASITLNFDAQGAASGSGGCNAYATGQVSHGAATLVMSQVTATTRACAEAALSSTETEYFRRLNSVRSYSMAASQLELRDSLGYVILRFERAP